MDIKIVVERDNVTDFITVTIIIAITIAIIVLLELTQ